MHLLGLPAYYYGMKIKVNEIVNTRIIADSTIIRADVYFHNACNDISLPPRENMKSEREQAKKKSICKNCVIHNEKLKTLSLF
jgi:hypothetical protein